MDDPRIRVDAVGDDCGFAMTVKRNCSMTPRQLVSLLAATALLNLGIGVAFALVGLWLVLPFAGLEMAALAAAFYVNARHATDYERITLADGRLTLEVSDAEKVRRYEFNPGWVRLAVRRIAGDVRVALSSHGREIEIGRHLDSAGRARFAEALSARLARI
jgi:uncharacterized membrane protein